MAKKALISSFVIIVLLFFAMIFSVWAQGIINLPQTGQTKCYDSFGTEVSCTGTGQDGELQTGVEWPDTRLTVSGDCVIDNLTGLMWAKNGNLPNGTRMWQGALDFVASINSGAGLCGYKDWRLPNVNELGSLVNVGESNPVIWLTNQGFSNAQSYYYWSSTTLVNDNSLTWIVSIWHGFVYERSKSYSYYIWPVRSGQLNTPDSQFPANISKTGQTITYATGDDGNFGRGVAWPVKRFTDNGDGTVTDNLTGLMWTKDANISEQKTWQESLDYVKTLGTGGHSDWRLPNKKELLSLIDRSRFIPALQASHPFQNVNVQSSNYWSSTSIALSTSFTPGVVYMWDGRVKNSFHSHYVWPMRGIPNPLNDTAEFVKQQYRDFLNREAESAGLQYWVNIINSGAMTRAQVIESFFWSEEFGLRIAPIVRLYFAYFLRIPDYGGLMYWIDQFSNGQSLGAISDAFASSPEFQQTYGALSNEGFVNLIYQNILWRAPDPGGYAFWVGELNSGRCTRGQVMVGFSESPEYRGLTFNEVFVTMMYVGMLRRAPEQGGFDWWVDYLGDGNSGLALIEGFLYSEEYANRFQ